MRSGWKAGNLKVALGLGSRADGGDMATAEQSVVERSEGVYRERVRYAMGGERESSVGVTDYRECNAGYMYKTPKVAGPGNGSEGRVPGIWTEDCPKNRTRC